MTTEMDLLQIASAFGRSAHCSVAPLYSGLINRTWKLTDAAEQYILQQINEQVFQHPEDIHHNIHRVRDYLLSNAPGYLFPAPISCLDGNDLLRMNGKCYRLFPFIAGSHTVAVAQHPGQAYEAAFQFGKFASLLAGFDVTQLRITIPRFHDLSFRLQQFQEAQRLGNPQRNREAASLISALRQYEWIEAKYRQLKQEPGFRLRVMHHDTKISNVLLDGHDKGICVIDLDTVMPGYFISDTGDMMRTYLSPVSEEESSFDRIEVRSAFYFAIRDGYMEAMKDKMTAIEKQSFFFSGQFMIYMQALRFLTDHLNNDQYYGAAYEGHNFVRAANQLTLLQLYTEKEDLWQ